MWSFSKTYSWTESGIFQGFVDYHSHILPGVDDGVRTIDEALKILSLYERLGIKAVWLTPHIMEDIPNTTLYLQKRFDELQSVYKGEVELYLAAEYMLDKLFCERLNNDDLLPLGKKGNHLLVETSYYNSPVNIHCLLERIKAKGFYPVLAHPERYSYMTDVYYKTLKKMGIRFQLNLLSLSGSYSNEVCRKAKWGIKNKFYDLIGTDTHSLNGVQSHINNKASLLEEIYHLVEQTI